MTRYFIKDESGMLELKMPATSTAVFRHVWPDPEYGTWDSYETKRHDDEKPLAIEEIEGVVMEAAE